MINDFELYLIKELLKAIGKPENDNLAGKIQEIIEAASVSVLKGFLYKYNSKKDKTIITTLKDALTRNTLSKIRDYLKESVTEQVEVVYKKINGEIGISLSDEYIKAIAEHIIDTISEDIKGVLARVHSKIGPHWLSAAMKVAVYVYIKALTIAAGNKMLNEKGIQSWVRGVCLEDNDEIKHRIKTLTKNYAKDEKIKNLLTKGVEKDQSEENERLSKENEKLSKENEKLKKQIEDMQTTIDDLKKAVSENEEGN